MTNPQLTYHSPHPRVRAFSSMWKGEVSGGQYDEFNVSPYCGDAPDAVMMNRKALCAEPQIDDTHLLMAHQVHGIEARIIIGEFFSPSLSTCQRLLEGADAFIAAIPYVCIGASAADCTPVLLYDEEHYAAAVVHAGRRGTVVRIVQKIVATMQQSYHVQLAYLHARTEPGIPLRHFEVGDEVYQAFAQVDFNMFATGQHMGKWCTNLLECNRLQLSEVDVSDDQVLSTGICTYEWVDVYFPARRLGIQSERIYNSIVLL